MCGLRPNPVFVLAARAFLASPRSAFAPSASSSAPFFLPRPALSIRCRLLAAVLPVASSSLLFPFRLVLSLGSVPFFPSFVSLCFPRVSFPWFVVGFQFFVVVLASVVPLPFVVFRGFSPVFLFGVLPFSAVPFLGLSSWFFPFVVWPPCFFRFPQDVCGSTAPTWQGGPLARPRCIPPARGPPPASSRITPPKRPPFHRAQGRAFLPLPKTPPRPTSSPLDRDRKAYAALGTLHHAFAHGDDQRAFVLLGTMTRSFRAPRLPTDVLTTARHRITRLSDAVRAM